MAPRVARPSQLPPASAPGGLVSGLVPGLGLALGLLVLGGAGPRPVSADAAQPPDGSAPLAGQAVAQVPTGHALAQRDKVLSAAARTAVSYVDAAAKALAAGEAGQAERLLAQAGALADQIERGVGYRGGGRPVAVIPVLARVRPAEGGELSTDLRARVQALEPQVWAGEHALVLEGLLDLGIGLIYEYVGMPLEATRDGLDRAREDLAKGDVPAARGHLSGIMRGLEIRTLTIGIPAPGQGAEPEPTPEPTPERAPNQAPEPARP